MDDIDELICREVNGDLGREDAERLRAWRSAAPRHEAHYQEMARLLRLSEAVIEPAPAPPPSLARPDRAEDGIIPLYSNRPVSIGWRVVRWGGAAAALVGLGILLFQRDRKPRAATLGEHEFKAGSSENATVTLGDGSVVRLAPNGRLRVIGTARDVFLDGRAFFAVAKRDGLPFRVNTAVGTVTVLGTEFDLTAAADEMQVIVVEGRVEFGVGTNQVQVGAGEVSRVRGSTVAAPTPVPDARVLVAWIGDFLVFRDAPLRKVAADLARHYRVTVEWRDSTLAGLTVTGRYADQSLREVVELVCGAVAAQCSVDGTVLTIGR